MKEIQNKPFTFHLEALCEMNSAFVVRVSCSNRFSEIKSRGIGIVEVALPLSHKWTVVSLDMKQLLKLVGRDFYCVKSIRLCANLLVRNVYSSSISYNSNTFPKSINFPTKSKSVWEDHYDFTWFPQRPIDAHLKENISQMSNVASVTSSAGSTKEVSKEVQPEPWLHLSAVIGFTSPEEKGAIRWSYDGNSLIYPSSCNIIVVTGSEQKILHGHTSNVNCLGVAQTQAPPMELIASSEAGKNPLIRLWDLSTGRCVGLTTGMHAICYSFSCIYQ